MENIEQRVKTLLAELTGDSINTIHNNTRFIEDLGMDSLDTVELRLSLEEEFSKEVPDSAVFLTIQDVIDYINKN